MAFSWNPFNRFKQNTTEKSVPTYQSHNQNFTIFDNVNNNIARAVMSRSVISQNIEKTEQLANPFYQLNFEDGILAMPLASNKRERIAQYKKMATYTETQWCLDEIADDFINDDENGNFINLKLPDQQANLNETRRSIIQNEFKKYINLFQLRDNGFNLIKKFLVEGELAWENVINHNHPEMGIIGVRYLPTEYYETLIDKNTNTPVGIIFDIETLERSINDILSNTYVGSAAVFNAITPVTYNFAFNKNKCIPMLWSQLTYINSGEYIDDNYIVKPLIDNAKQAYYQLTLLHDAAVILRVTRAPERLVYNISTGKMPQNYADEYVRNFANSLKAKKVASPDGQNIQGIYNPVSMLENYVFGKSDGNDGTTVESVTSSAAYDQMEDIKYFFRRFVKQFKVPFSRFEQPENAKPGDGQMPTEEYAFLRMILRFQRRFSLGFKQGFITHLKLRDIWDKYELKESDIDVAFTPPPLYDLYTRQKIMETKMATYKTVTDNEEMSKSLAMKKYLDYTDAQVLENYKQLMWEKSVIQLGDYWSGKINSDGATGEWNIPPIPIKGISDKDESSSESTDNSTESTEPSDDQPKDEEPPEQDNSPKPTFGLN